MKIVIAPDSYKESLSAIEVAAAIAEGLAAVWPEAELVLVPVADGGEGTVQALVDATDGSVMTVDAHDPLGRPIRAPFGMLGAGSTAVVEVAAASGLDRLQPSERAPFRASSYGTGELIRAALEHNPEELIIGLGGSATNDGGAGLLQALGARLTDSQGRDLEPGNEALEQLATIDFSGIDLRLAKCRLTVASDVTNPLCGRDGASAVFGPQKGAHATDIDRLDANLQRLGNALESASDNPGLREQPGAGAAGGIGAALLALSGTIEPGIDRIARAAGLPEALKGADYLFTGEGQMDAQTVNGKAPVGVARFGVEAGVPVIALAGSVAPDAALVNEHGIDAVFSITPSPMTLESALSDAAGNLRRTATQVARLLALR